MVRESRHLFVGNIPDNADETAVSNYFSPFGEVDKLEFLTTKDSPAGVTAVVSFLSLQIATKIHKMSHTMGNNALSTRYHDHGVSHPTKIDLTSKDRQRDYIRKRSVSPNTSREFKRTLSVPVHGRSNDDFDPRKRVVICHSLADNHSANALTAGLYHEFKQIGKIKNLWIHEDSRGNKSAVVMFYDSRDSHTALQDLDGKMQFGKPLDIELVKDKDAFTHYPDNLADISPRRGDQHRSRSPGIRRAPLTHRHSTSDDLITDEGASSTLFVGNLSGNVRYKDLMSLFKRYGDIECIDIKESDKGYPYAFIRYYQLKSACHAKKYLNEEVLHERCMKIGYGKGCQTNTVMAMEIDRSCPESKVEQEFSKFGELVRMTYNAALGSALCTYDNTDSAQLAIEHMRGRCLGHTGRVKVDFANHEECQEFYHNYERCKASQQLMRFHMDILTRETEQPGRKYEDFRVDGRSRGGYGDRKFSPDNRDMNRSYGGPKRYERVERTTSRNTRDISPASPVRNRYSSPPRRNRSMENNGSWKGKGKSSTRKYSPEHSHRRSKSPRASMGDKSTKNFVANRYNSEEREMARNINRESNRASRDRGDFENSKRRSTKKRRSSSLTSTQSKHKYKSDSRVERKEYKPRGPGLMDNDWSDYKKPGAVKTEHVKSRPKERRSRSREKRKKEKKHQSALSEEEEELINSLIAMRRVEKSLQKRDSGKKRGQSDKRKRRRKQSSDESSDDSSSSSSQSSAEDEIDVGRVESRDTDKQPVTDAKEPSDSALERIAKIISNTTNGQVQLNQNTTQNSECYSPGEEFKQERPTTPIQTMIPIPAAIHQPFLNPPPSIQQTSELLMLLRKYPIMWNGCIALKNDTANVQLHFLSGSAGIAEGAIGALPNLGPGPMRIAQRMRLEPNQIEGVQKRMQHDGQWCMLLALPHGTDPISVNTQTTTLQNGFISYLNSKQAAGIINLPVPDMTSPYVLHIFPPCEFTQVHMKKFCPELIEGAGDCGYLLIVIATV